MRLTQLVAVVCGVSLSGWMAVAGQAGDKAGTQVEKEFTSAKFKIGYLLYLPEGYGKADKKWPLIMFLHGSGESGVKELAKVKKHGPPKVAEAKKLPFVVVSPQSPGMGWQVEGLNLLLDDVLAKYKCDPDRVYLTGLSMGGSGTWNFAAAHPERFAAVVPMASGPDPKLAPKLKNLPIWVHYGAKDKDAGLKRCEEMNKILKDTGGDAKLTVYPDAGHDCWTVPYGSAELYDWLLAHKRAKK